MFGIIGENYSDVSTLKVLVRRILDDTSVTIKTKGYNGCSELLRKGSRQLDLFLDIGMTKFIVCHDADCVNPIPSYEKVRTEILAPSNINKDFCILVPVQELEAWILANLSAVNQVIKSWKPKDEVNPEYIDSPKEYLEKLSRNVKSRPRYVHAIHNEKVAKHLDLQIVENKCPSFRPLLEFLN